MIFIDDPNLPGLSELSESQLRRIANVDSVSIERMRYREGLRSVLHIRGRRDCHEVEGSVWIFCGGKGAKLAAKNVEGRYDVETGAFFQEFPADHRLPELAKFLKSPNHYSTSLSIDPDFPDHRTLRYRPGLSCTFECRGHDSSPVFVKIFRDNDTKRALALNSHLRSSLSGSLVSVAPMIGHAQPISAVSYACAPGIPLDILLTDEARVAENISLTISALGDFSRLNISDVRMLSTETLIRRARDTLGLVVKMAPDCYRTVKPLFEYIESNVPDFDARVIHGDIKLEHVFISNVATLIDIESISIGPADYDLAQLYGRVCLSEIEGKLTTVSTHRATEEIRRVAGPSFVWCSALTAMRMVRFYVQRPTSDRRTSIKQILAMFDPVLNVDSR